MIARLTGIRAGALDLDHFRARVLQDALSEATAEYWRRRARTLERALSRASDYRGRATPEEIAQRDEGLRAAIMACSLRAQLCEPGAEISAEVDEVLAEVAA